MVTAPLTRCLGPDPAAGQKHVRDYEPAEILEGFTMQWGCTLR
jgi:hypothetical protein